MALWGSSFIALKLAVGRYDPVVILFGRMIVASFCFLFFMRRVRGNSYQPGDWKLILFMVLCEPCLYFVFEVEAIQYTTASQAGMITAMLPLMVALAARLLLKERVSGLTFVGFALAVAGVVFLTLTSLPTEDAPNPMMGNFLEFMAMVCATGYTIVLKRLTSRYNPFFLTAVQAFGGTLFFLPVLFWDPSRWPTAFDPVPIFSIVYLGVFISLGAYGLYNYGMSVIPASQASAFVNLIPVFTIVLGWTVLGETFTFLQSLACLLVFAGVFLTQGRDRSKLHGPPLETSAESSKKSCAGPVLR